MCKKFRKRCKIADFEKVMRFRNGTGHRTGGTGNERWPVVRFGETAPGQRAGDTSAL